MKPTITSYSHSATNAAVLRRVTTRPLSGRKILDVGSGEGYFVRLLSQEVVRQGADPAQIITASDPNPENFRIEGHPCVKLTPGQELPFEDGSFDHVCAIEVIEHVEDQFAFTRELHRVLKPGGRAAVTTPNLLNINSRLRYLCCGFWLLFNPLPLRHDGAQDSVHAATGHIHPTTAYYLIYMLQRAGFEALTVDFDRGKKSARALTLLLAPLLILGALSLRYRMKRKQPEVYADNQPYIKVLNSLGMLTARTVIVEGTRPASAAARPATPGPTRA
jgi:SAM-dependent methyltransferase